MKWQPGNNNARQRALPAGYKYCQPLKELEHRSWETGRGELERAKEVVTPLLWSSWEMLLKDHPDRWWVSYLVRGIKEGFRVWFAGGQGCLKSGTTNMGNSHSDP